MKHDDYSYMLASCPNAAPLTRKRFSIPELWQNAKAMLARMLEAAGGAARVREQKRFTRKDRAEIVTWLEPVEKLTRALLLARAITQLLMTPNDRKLMRETPKQAPWAPPPKPSRYYSTLRLPYPGCHIPACTPSRAL